MKKTEPEVRSQEPEGMKDSKHALSPFAFRLRTALGAAKRLRVNCANAFKIQEPAVRGALTVATNWRLAALLLVSIFHLPFSRLALAAQPSARPVVFAPVPPEFLPVAASPTFYNADQIFTKVFNGSNAVNVAVVSPGPASTASGAAQVLNASFNGSNALNVICLSGCVPALNQVGNLAVSATQTFAVNAGWTLDASSNTGTVTALTASTTGTGTTNVGASFSASGATNNYGLLVSSGNVGIGTASPNLQLQVAKAIGSGLNTVTFSAAPTFDASLGNTQEITLTGNVTSSTLSNAIAGEKLNFVICQDATGSRTFQWPSQMHGAMTIGSTASKCSAQDFIFDGTNAYALSAGVVNQ